MSNPKEPANPFYLLLVVVGVVFLITACAYGTMAYRALAPDPQADRHELMTFMDTHGVELLTGELVLLAACTFGAMWLDRYRAQNPGQSNEFDHFLGQKRG